MGIIHACFGERGPIGIILVIHSWLANIRFGCVCGPTGLDQVRAVYPLVLPLPHVRRGRLRLYRLLFLGVPVQKAGWCVHDSSRMVTPCRLRFELDILEEIGQRPRELNTSEQNYYRQIIGQRAVHTMAFFILIYTG